MAKELYHILKDGIPSEVLTRKELIEKVKNNILNKDTLIWCSKWNDNGNSQEWKKIGEVFEVEKEVNKKFNVSERRTLKYILITLTIFIPFIIIISLLSYNKSKIKKAINFCQNNFTSNSNNKTLFNNCLIAAKQNDLISEYNLGILYMNGRSVTRNLENAYRWLAKASKDGHNDAKYIINMHFNIIRKNLTTFESIKITQLDNIKDGYWQTNYLLEHNGKNILDRFNTRNYYLEDLIFQNLKSRANRNDAIAQFDLGNLYFHGIKVENNNEEAAKWFEKSANAGIKEAQYNLGMLHYNNKLNKSDSNKAYYWINKAAQQELREALNILGQMFSNNTLPDTILENFDDILAAELARVNFAQAAEAGLDVAQFNLGLLYYSGKGVSQNYLEAAKWFKEAANQGIKDAQYNLGVMYYNGLGVEKDEQKALESFQLAANNDSNNAQFNLGLIYDLGEIQPQNFQNAFQWIKKAADENNNQAICILGGMYFYGHGVKKDLIEASKWLRLAAKNDCSQAIKILNDNKNIFGEI